METTGPFNGRVLRDEILRFLSAYHTMALATVDEHRQPHAVSLLYALDGLALVWTSEPGSRHSQHLAHAGATAATVAPDYDDFQTIRGVQIHGRAHRLHGDPAERARGLLVARYPFLARLDAAPPALAAAWQRAAFYRLDPHRIAIIDNTRGFGDKRTLEVRRR
jgi:uncharacterized protein